MNKHTHMRLFIWIFLSLFFFNINTQASHPAPEGEKPVVIDKTRLLLSKIKQGDFTHAGDQEAVNLVLNKVRDSSPKVLQENCLEIGCGFGGTIIIAKNI